MQSEHTNSWFGTEKYLLLLSDFARCVDLVYQLYTTGSTKLWCDSSLSCEWLIKYLFYSSVTILRQETMLYLQKRAEFLELLAFMLGSLGVTNPSLQERMLMWRK